MFIAVFTVGQLAIIQCAQFVLQLRIGRIERGSDTGHLFCKRASRLHHVEADEGVRASCGIQPRGDLPNRAETHHRDTLANDGGALHQSRKREARQAEERRKLRRHAVFDWVDKGMRILDIHHDVRFVPRAIDHAVAGFHTGDIGADFQHAPHPAVAGHKRESRPGARGVIQPLVNAGVYSEFGAGADGAAFTLDQCFAGFERRQLGFLHRALVRLGHDNLDGLHRNF
jgi:hypothetical protein